MPVEISVPIGLMIERTRVETPWREYRWRTVRVFLEADSTPRMHRLSSGMQGAPRLVTTLPLVLESREVTSYQVNLTNGEPSLYVVLRHEPGKDDRSPVRVHGVTASPFAAQARSDVALDTVDRVPMPHQLVRIVQTFIEEHPLEEPVTKRARRPDAGANGQDFTQDRVVSLRDYVAGGHTTGAGDER